MIESSDPLFLLWLLEDKVKGAQAFVERA